MGEDLHLDEMGYRVAPDLHGTPTLWCKTCGRDGTLHFEDCTSWAARDFRKLRADCDTMRIQRDDARRDRNKAEEDARLMLIPRDMFPSASSAWDDALKAENARLRTLVVRARCRCVGADCVKHGAYYPELIEDAKAVEAGQPLPESRDRKAPPK